LTGAGRRALARFRGRHLGFVFQTYNLIPELTAWENVLLAARYVGSARKEAEATARDLLERLGVWERAEQYPPALSGGEQQRVAFCRAVLNAPAVILADEPTGNLDEENAAVLLEELRTRARGGAAVLLVTHSAELARNADRALQLAGGQLTGIRP
jgi:lipoprotein-releasing system ATP-binding protein